MTDESKLIQVQKQERTRSRLSSDQILQYIGKRVVVEIESTGGEISSGNLTAYDGKRVTLQDFNQHKTSLESAIELPGIQKGTIWDIESDYSVKYTIPRKTINAFLIATIQSFDDVLKSREDYRRRQSQ
ncbi:MAG: hypothetical protein ABH840_03935 [Nanoarchaeota archaeon]